MQTLRSYLAEHFLDATQMAKACALPENDFLALVRDHLVPGPSYVVSDAVVTSHVFGRMPAESAPDGSYFHPATHTWVRIARDVIDEVGRDRAHDVLKHRFATNLRDALCELNASVWRLRDSYGDDGSAIEEGLSGRIDSVWEHFLHGTFGLCVANPVSEAAIARKEVLQEKLTALSDNGSKSAYPADETPAMLALIDAYATAAMPFSPIEYPISSRKRLVEDLRARIATAQHGTSANTPGAPTTRPACA